MRTVSYSRMTKFLFILAIPFLTFGQDRSLYSFSDQWDISPQYGYIHIGLGTGVSHASSPEIEKVIEPFEIYPVSYERNFNISCGYKNIFQCEYRKNRSNHDFYFTAQRLNGGEFVEDVYETGMELTFDDWLFKVNPFFKITGDGLAIFLTYGVGSVDYLENAKSGFVDGNDSVYGIEAGYILKYLSTSVALEYRHINFDRAHLDYFDSIEQNFEMGYVTFGLKLCIGFGL